MDHKDASCTSCSLLYDDNNLAWRLECGHAFCSWCVDDLLSKGDLCNACQTQFHSSHCFPLPPGSVRATSDCFSIFAETFNTRARLLEPCQNSKLVSDSEKDTLSFYENSDCLKKFSETVSNCVMQLAPWQNSKLVNDKDKDADKNKDTPLLYESWDCFRKFAETFNRRVRQLESYPNSKLVSDNENNTLSYESSETKSSERSNEDYKKCSKECGELSVEDAYDCVKDIVKNIECLRSIKYELETDVKPQRGTSSAQGFRIHFLETSITLIEINDLLTSLQKMKVAIIVAKDVPKQQCAVEYATSQQPRIKRRILEIHTYLMEEATRRKAAEEEEGCRSSERDLYICSSSNTPVKKREEWIARQQQLRSQNDKQWIESPPLYQSTYGKQVNNVMNVSVINYVCYHTITAIKDYEDKSFEELRLKSVLYGTDSIFTWSHSFPVEYVINLVENENRRIIPVSAYYQILYLMREYRKKDTNRT